MLPSVPAGQDFFPILKSHANHFLVLPTARMSLPPLSMRKGPCQGLNSPAPSGVQVTRNMSINLDASHSQDIQHGASNCSPNFPPTVWNHHKFRLGENVYSSLFFTPPYLIYQQVLSTLLPKDMLHSSLLAFTTVTTRSKLLSSLTWTTTRVS